MANSIIQSRDPGGKEAALSFSGFSSRYSSLSTTQLHLLLSLFALMGET